MKPELKSGLTHFLITTGAVLLGLVAYDFIIKPIGTSLTVATTAAATTPPKTA